MRAFGSGTGQAKRQQETKQATPLNKSRDAIRPPCGAVGRSLSLAIGDGEQLHPRRDGAIRPYVLQGGFDTRIRPSLRHEAIPVAERRFPMSGAG